MKKMYFGIFLSRRCKIIVVGGGKVAYGKIRTLSRFTNNITVLSKDFREDTLNLIKEKGLNYIQDEYNIKYIAKPICEKYTILIAATNFKKVNRGAYRDAKQFGILANVVDDTEYCDFIMPAFTQIEDLTIAVSSGANGPSITRLVRQWIDTMLPNHIKGLMGFAKKYRRRIANEVPSPLGRRRLWRDMFFDSGMLEQDPEEIIKSYSKESVEGIVYFVSAGPGNKDLITMRGSALLQMADVVMYDHLAEGLIDLSRIDAVLVSVAKFGYDKKHSVKQDEINHKLAEYAKEGEIVVRLKGGDAGIFGQIADEVAHLEKEGIRYEIVPGVSSGMSLLSDFGIPLTMKEKARGVRFVTYYTEDAMSALDLESVAKTTETVIFYMSGCKITRLANTLLKYGFDKSRPIAIASNVSMPNKSLKVVSIGDILADKVDFPKPSLIIIGAVIDHKFHNHITHPA